MPLMYGLLAFLCFFGGARDVFLIFMLAGTETLMLGMAQGLRRAGFSAIDEREIKRFASSALAFWLLVSIAVLVFAWVQGQQHMAYALAYVSWALFDISLGIMRITGRRKIAWGMLLVGGAGIIAAAFFPQTYRVYSMMCVLLLPSMVAICANGKPVKFDKQSVCTVLRFGRRGWFSNAWVWLPIFPMAGHGPVTLMIGVLCVALVRHIAQKERFDARESAGWLTVAAAVFLLATVLGRAFRAPLNLPNWYLVPVAWAMIATCILGIGRKKTRYAVVAAGVIALISVTPLAPGVAGDLIAVLAFALLFWILHPCIYETWLPLRARILRLRRRKSLPRKV